MAIDIAELRLNYTQGGIEKDDLAVDPFDQFRSWLEKAVEAELPEPNAMTLSTCNGDGILSSRTVLLKGLDDGFCLYSNYRSQKAQEIEANPNAALTFLWHALERQVNIQGEIEKMSPAASATYFHSRPYASQIGAWVSEWQSAEIPDRAELEARELALRQQFPEGQVPMPEFWGGYRLIPTVIEFWQGREGRLHDRLRYVKDGEEWQIVRLSP